MKPLATIGYESQTQDKVIADLRAAGVEVLIDVRAVASSRRAGFSKSLLAASLAEAGIEYVHLRQLGTPKAGRDAAPVFGAAVLAHLPLADERGQCDLDADDRLEHLAEPAAQVELVRATEIAGHRRAALLCYEADAACCHRAIVADRIRQALKCEVVDL